MELAEVNFSDCGGWLRIIIIFLVGWMNEWVGTGRFRNITRHTQKNGQSNYKTTNQVDQHESKLIIVT